MAATVFFFRVSGGGSGGGLITPTDNIVASTEALRCVLGAGTPNHTYNLRRNAVNIQNIFTDNTGLSNSTIFIPGVAAGTYTYDVRDPTTQEVAGVTTIVVTGGAAGGGGMSKWMLIGLAVAGFFLLKGGKRLKW